MDRTGKAGYMDRPQHKEVAEIRGKQVEAVRSSAKTDRGDFSELIHAAYELAAEMGVEV